MRKFAKWFGWGLMTFFAIAIVLYAFQYLTLNPDVFFPQQREVYLAHQAGIFAHVFGGILALALGPFQFLKRLRTSRPGIHRWMGRIYLLGILIGGTAGLYMAFFAFAGPVASLGFGGLAIAWLITGYFAYSTIRAGKTTAHRQWMTRNFSLTFAAVTLRLWMPLMSGLFGETTGYEVTAWICWVPNLIIAEGMVRGWFRGPGRPGPIQSAAD